MRRSLTGKLLRQGLLFRSRLRHGKACGRERARSLKEKIPTQVVELLVKGALVGCVVGANRI